MTCGLLAGAAVLTRIDTAMLCVIVAAVVTRRSGLGATLRVAGVAFLVVATACAQFIRNPEKPAASQKR